MHIRVIPKATRGSERISYRGALPSTLLHATACVFFLHNLLILLVRFANKIGLQKMLERCFHQQIDFSDLHGWDLMYSALSVCPEPELRDWDQLLLFPLGKSGRARGW
jgi:hypothetical protein